MAKCAPKPLRRFALGGSLTDTDLSKFAQGLSQTQQQKNPLATIDNQIAMGNAVDNSNLTMSEKAALGFGTTSADASALRQKTSALSTLRDGMAAQLQPQTESAWIGGGTANPTASTLSTPRDTNQPVIEAMNKQATGWKDFRTMQNNNAAKAGESAGLTGFDTTEKRNVNGLAGFADGGKVDAADELLRRMASKYGVSADSAPVQPQAIAAPSPVQPRPATTLNGVVDLMRNRQAQIAKAVGYANGGKITGPGTPTSDSIPARVQETGEPIKVSTGERIVSASQEVLLGRIAEMLGFDSVDAMLEAGTGKPVGPTIKHGKGFGFGGRIGDDPENPTPSQKYGTKMLSMKDVAATFAATPEQKASAARAAESFKQDRGIPSIASNVTAPQVKVNDIPPLGDAPSVTPAEPQQQSPAVENKQTPSIGSITMGGRTKSLAAMAAGSNGYVDAAGKPVEKWEQTARYAEQMRVNEGMRKAADQLHRWNVERDANDPTITNQDVRNRAMVELARLDKNAGAATDNQLKQQQIASLEMDMQGKQRLQSVADAYSQAKTPEERQAIADYLYALQGKEPNNRFTVIHGEESIDPTTQLKIRGPSQVLNNRTGQLMNFQQDAAQGKLPAPKSEAEMKALPKGARFVAPDGSVRVKQ